MRQYVAVRFREGDKRTYTYHNDGPPVTVGDPVRIPDRHRPDEWSRATVTAIVDKPRGFETKAIGGKADGAAVDERILATPPEAAPDLFRDYVEEVRSGLAGPDMFSGSPGWEE